MQKTTRIDDVLTEKNWFKLDWTPNGVVKDALTHPDYCLALALGALGLWNRWRHCLERIVVETFPERVEGSLPDIIIQTFNNHKETTWQDVEKIMREFERQKEFMESG